MRTERTLEIKWTTSKARDSYGYDVCTLFVNAEKAARCNGGGYDMKGTVLGTWLARAFSDRLLKLTAADMPAHTHWQRAENPRRLCDTCLMKWIGEGAEPPYLPAEALVCPTCGSETRQDHHDGVTVEDGRYFYGLTFIVGKDCQDRTLTKVDGESEGLTVEQAEDKGVSFGLERIQAAYRASSKTPTERHTVPLIDGACGWSSVEAIAKAIGITLEWHRTHSKNIELWTAHVDEVEEPGKVAA
jgi:hypothetical protein